VVYIIGDMEEVHHTLNIVFFGGVLPLSRVILEPLPTAFGMCNGPYIWIDPTHCNTEALFIGTIAHEMVHQWQWIRGKELDHGRSFIWKCRQIEKVLSIPVR